MLRFSRRDYGDIDLIHASVEVVGYLVDSSFDLGDAYLPSPRYVRLREIPHRDASYSRSRFARPDPPSKAIRKDTSRAPPTPRPEPAFASS
jgi:hypothetical protein